MEVSNRHVGWLAALPTEMTFYSSQDFLGKHVGHHLLKGGIDMIIREVVIGTIVPNGCHCEVVAIGSIHDGGCIDSRLEGRGLTLDDTGFERGLWRSLNDGSNNLAFGSRSPQCQSFKDLVNICPPL